MDLTKLFEMQNKLDSRITTEKGIGGRDLLPKKVLALQVELGELANELPEVFKFWSNKKNNYDKALVEYCDCLHFILSIGLERDETIMTVPYDRGWLRKEESLTEQFNSLFDVVGNFGRYRTVGNYSNILDLFLGLGEMLGFTWEQIENGYLAKNEINHARQDSKY